MDAIFDFIDNFARMGYKDLPGAAIEAARKEVVDSLAAALGGSSRPGVPELAGLAKEWGGAGQSTVLGYGFRCPAPEAALVNGTMVHALDYDDGHPVAQVHIGCVAVPTCFAVAERQGGIGGRDLLTVLALGEDFLARLSLASRPNSSLVKSGWHPTPLCGYLGAAAIAGKIMGLDRDKMASALGIAYHQCAGNSQAVEDGALTKRLGPGLAARGGITAALMAGRGITGARNVLEGKYGFFRQYHGGDYSPEILTAGLGKRFEGTDIGYKPYPNCGFTHPFIDAVLNLKTKYHILPKQVQGIVARGGDPAYELTVPLEVKRAPRNPVDAQFSLPWAIAVALVNGEVTLKDFTAEAIKKEELLDISRKVTGELDTSLSRHGVGPGRVTILMKDGTKFSDEVENFLGSVARPMTFDDCAGKFRQCAAEFIKPLDRGKIEKVIGMVRDLENLADATEIVRMLG